jgi:multiple sugar transport system permease protein
MRRPGFHLDAWRFTLYGAALIVAGICLFPYLVMVSTALKPDAELAGAQSWLPTAPNWSIFVDIWTDETVLRGLRNSLVIAFGVTFLTLACAIPAAYALARHRFPLRDGFMTVVLVTQMLSPIVVIVPLFQTATDLGLLGGFPGVILASSAFILPFSIWLLTGFFSAISTELEEAATLDACGRLATLWHVILPLSLPGLAATAVYSFLFGWNEFVISLTFLSAVPEKWPVTVGVFSSIGQWDIGWQALMMTALISTLPVLLLFSFVQKYLDRGFATLIGR